MDIEVHQIIGLWNGLNQVYAENEKLDGVFDYFMQKQNIPILQKEVQKLQELDDDTFSDIKGKSLNLPLQSIQPDMLPANMPKGVVNLLDPIIDGNINMDGYESQIDTLLEQEPAKNGTSPKNENE